MKPPDHTWTQYLRNGIGLKLSKLGEFLKIDSWTYNPVILELFHSIAVQNAPKVVSSVTKVFPTLTALVDVGCGSGAFAAEFNRKGINSIGLERSKHGIQLAKSQGVECYSFDVRTACNPDFCNSFDLAYSFEVAEHLPEELGDAFVEYMTELSDRILFAAAQPGQGGIGHINEQPIEYWIEKFAKRGFAFDQTTTDSLRTEFRAHSASPWFENNSCLFRKSSSDET